MYMRMVRWLKASSFLDLFGMTCSAQQTYDPYPDAPMPLRNHTWSQPKLRKWLRFTPPVEFPTRGLDAPLLWTSSQQGEGVSITTYIKNLDLCIQTRLGLEVRGAADHFLVIEELKSGTAWLTSTPVQDWYHTIPFNAQKVFSSCVVDLHDSTMARLDKVGGLITLSHLVCLSHCPNLQSLVFHKIVS